jgi:hypothetical protein
MTDKTLPPYAEKYFDAKFSRVFDELKGLQNTATELNHSVQKQAKLIDANTRKIEVNVFNIKRHFYYLIAFLVLGTFIWVKESRDFILSKMGFFF